MSTKNIFKSRKVLNKVTIIWQKCQTIGKKNLEKKRKRTSLENKIQAIFSSILKLCKRAGKHATPCKCRVSYKIRLNQ